MNLDLVIKLVAKWIEVHCLRLLFVSLFVWNLFFFFYFDEKDESDSEKGGKKELSCGMQLP